MRHYDSLSLQEIFAIDDAFREAGLEIAFPQQEVTIKAVDVHQNETKPTFHLQRTAKIGIMGKTPAGHRPETASTDRVFLTPLLRAYVPGRLGRCQRDRQYARSAA